MHTLRNRFLIYVPTLLCAVAALGLHRYMMETCIDEWGLLIPGNLPGRLLWALGIAFPAGLMLLLRTIGGEGSYADNFPRFLLGGCLMLSAGVVLLMNAKTVSLPPLPAMPVQTQGMSSALSGFADGAMQVLPWLAGGSMLVLGVYRMAGRRPHFLFSGSICLFYMLMLVQNYRRWSADPQLHEYCFPLLALVLLLLCSFHRTCCDAGIIQRKKLLLTGLTAAVCSAGAISSGFLPGFCLASALWGAGCVCDPAVLPPDPEPKPAGPETENEAGIENEVETE